GGTAVELVGKPNGGKAILHGHDREQFEPSGRQLNRPAPVGLHDAVLLSAVRKHAVALGLETWNITRAHGAIHPSAGTGSHVIVAVEGSHDAAPIVAVPDLQKHALTRGIAEQTVKGRQPRVLTTQHASVRTHQLLEELEVVL